MSTFIPPPLSTVLHALSAYDQMEGAVITKEPVRPPFVANRQQPQLTRRRRRAMEARERKGKR